LQWTQGHFQAKQVDSPRLAAELLLAEAMSCRKIELYTRFEETPPAERVARFRALVLRAAAHEPVAYLLGRREFYSMMFRVSPDVLIPRPETETLVERALAWCKELADERIEVFDMGTGSGCIAAAVAKFEPRARVVASDVSEAALAVARENISANELGERVQFVRADGPALPADARPADGFHLIVSNPPYIADAQRETLPANVRDYEPHAALFASDGLVFYRRLAVEGADLLRTDGRCYVEVGMDQAADVRGLFESAGWGCAGVWRDPARIDRVLGFVRP
jgi:release factor glutamine methyltransferase